MCVCLSDHFQKAAGFVVAISILRLGKGSGGRLGVVLGKLPNFYKFFLLYT